MGGAESPLALVGHDSRWEQGLPDIGKLSWQKKGKRNRFFSSSNQLKASISLTLKIAITADTGVFGVG